MFIAFCVFEGAKFVIILHLLLYYPNQFRVALRRIVPHFDSATLPPSWVDKRTGLGNPDEHTILRCLFMGQQFSIIYS